MGLFASRRLAVAALAIGISAASVACSSGSGGKKSLTLGARTGGGVQAPADSGAPGAGAAGASASASVANGGPPAAGPGTTSAPGGAPAPTKPSGPTATTAATVPRPTAPPASGPGPAATGTYHYNGGGTSVLTTGTTTTPQTVPAQSTLTVTATGPGTEQWVNSSTTANLVFNGSGVFLTSETVFGTTCAFDTPVPFPPWPPAVGKSFSGQATCGSGSSASTLMLTGRIAGTASVSVAGTKVSTYLVQSKLTLSGTSLVIGETDYYAPSLRLPVESIVAATGGITGYSIASNTAYVLTSLLPS